MASKKKYTLTKKKSVRKGGDNGYTHYRGDVIGQEEYDKLIDRHQEVFEEGAKDLTKNETPADRAQNKQLEALTTRVEALEAKVGIEPAKDEDASGDEKEDAKKDDKSGSSSKSKSSKK